MEPAGQFLQQATLKSPPFSGKPSGRERGQTYKRTGVGRIFRVSMRVNAHTSQRVEDKQPAWTFSRRVTWMVGASQGVEEEVEEQAPPPAAATPEERKRRIQEVAQEAAVAEAAAEDQREHRRRKLAVVAEQARQAEEVCVCACYVCPTPLGKKKSLRGNPGTEVDT